MCKWGDCVNIDIAGSAVSVDRCIAPMVSALNAAGVETIASCCGHGNCLGRIALRDGREIFMAPDFETAEKINRAWPTDIHGELKPTQEATGTPHGH